MRYWTWTAAFLIWLRDPDQCRHCFNDRHKPPTSRLSHIYAVGSRGFTAANRGPGWCPVVVLQGVKIVGACIHVHNERHVTKDDGTTGHIGSMGKGGIRKTLLITTYLGILSTRVGQGRHAMGICPWLLCATGATGIWGVGARCMFFDNADAVSAATTTVTDMSTSTTITASTVVRAAAVSSGP